jgi:glycosyltransferase involved in cell wall biosynthesis
LKALTGSRVALVGHGIEVWNPPARLRWFTRRMDRVLPVSRFTADQMIAWGVKRERVTLLPDTVDGEVFRPVGDGSRVDRLRLLTVARLASSEQYKGIDRVLDALARVRSSTARVSYRIAGTGDDLPRLHRLVTERGLDDVVEFLGFVDDERLPGLYSDSDLFIMPSTREGFGIVFLESLACGTPVVAGNRDGSVDALCGGRLGRLVDPQDADELAAAILESMEPVEDRATRRRRLRDQVLEEYGFDRFRRRVGEVVKQELSA